MRFARLRSYRSPSLRRRLVVGLLGLVTLGLAVFSLGTYLMLDSSLDRRAERDVASTTRAAATAIDAQMRRAPPTGPGRTQVARMRRTLQAVLPPSGVALYHGPANLRIRESAPDLEGHHEPPAGTATRLDAMTPAPPTRLPLRDIDEHARARVAIIDATVDGTDYRVGLIRPRTGGRILVGFALTEWQTTLHRLVVTEATAGGLLLVAMAGLAWLVVWHGLRPLNAIVTTANAITHGDRSRRVPMRASGTEVGRVATALNRMLDDNESALVAKEASEEQLRQFVANASHELRTPLASIRTYSELLGSGAAETTEQRSLALGRIESESVRMSRMVEGLLTLARLDSDRPLGRQHVDIVGVTTDAVADARALDPHRTVRVRAPDRLEVMGDSDQLYQVLSNLLTNALLHTPAGTPIDIELVAEAGHAAVRVRDHGPGLTPQQTAHVFDRFYRADPGRSRQFNGSGGAGLGLSIVAAIVAAHGGSVAADSAPGGGALFTVRLPIADDRTRAAHAQPNP